MSGNIPSELGSIFTLDKLYLHVNEFTGVMPEEVCYLKIQNNLNVLWADCGDDQPQVSCSCCTECFGNDSDFIPFEGFVNDSYAPTLTPTMQPVGNSNGPEILENPELKSFLLQHMDGFEDSLSDVNSPQYEAYLWLANSRNHDKLDEFQKIQR